MSVCVVTDRLALRRWSSDQQTELAAKPGRLQGAMF